MKIPNNTVLYCRSISMIERLSLFLVPRSTTMVVRLCRVDSCLAAIRSPDQLYSFRFVAIYTNLRSRYALILHFQYEPARKAGTETCTHAHLITHGTHTSTLRGVPASSAEVAESLQSTDFWDKASADSSLFFHPRRRGLKLRGAPALQSLC